MDYEVLKNLFMKLGDWGTEMNMWERSSHFN